MWIDIGVHIVTVYEGARKTVQDRADICTKYYPNQRVMLYPRVCRKLPGEKPTQQCILRMTTLTTDVIA
jgi:hypothetical protein